jgi:hypothetical protein
MNADDADAGATDGALTPISQPPQNSYPRSSAFIRGKILSPSAHSDLRRQLVGPSLSTAAALHATRPAQLRPPGASTTTRPPPQPRKSLRRNPYAQSARRSPHRGPSSPPSPAPRGGPPPACRPPRHAPPAKCICPPQPVRPEKSPPPTPRHGNPRHPPTRISPPQRRTPRETALPPPHHRALRALRGGSSSLPTRICPPQRHAPRESRAARNPPSATVAASRTPPRQTPSPRVPTTNQFLTARPDFDIATYSQLAGARYPSGALDEREPRTHPCST